MEKSKSNLPHGSVRRFRDEEASLLSHTSANTEESDGDGSKRSRSELSSRSQRKGMVIADTDRVGSSHRKRASSRSNGSEVGKDRGLSQEKSKEYEERRRSRTAELSEGDNIRTRESGYADRDRTQKSLEGKSQAPRRSGEGDVTRQDNRRKEPRSGDGRPEVKTDDSYRKENMEQKSRDGFRRGRPASSPSQTRKFKKEEGYRRRDETQTSSSDGRRRTLRRQESSSRNEKGRRGEENPKGEHQTSLPEKGDKREKDAPTVSVEDSSPHESEGTDSRTSARPRTTVSIGDQKQRFSREISQREPNEAHRGGSSTRPSLREESKRTGSSRVSHEHRLSSDSGRSGSGPNTSRPTSRLSSSKSSSSRNLRDSRSSGSGEKSIDEYSTSSSDRTRESSRSRESYRRRERTRSPDVSIKSKSSRDDSVRNGDDRTRGDDRSRVSDHSRSSSSWRSLDERRHAPPRSPRSTKSDDSHQLVSRKHSHVSSGSSRSPRGIAKGAEEALLLMDDDEQQERLREELAEEEAHLKEEQARLEREEADRRERQEAAELRRQELLEEKLKEEKAERKRRQEEEEAEDRRQEALRLEQLRLQEEAIMQEEFGEEGQFGSTSDQLSRDIDEPIEEEFYNSDEDGPSRTGRREFWDKVQSTRLMKTEGNSSHGDEFGLGDHIIGSSIHISRGNAAMFNLFDQDLKKNDLHPFVLRVLKLAFSSLAVVFQETAMNPKEHHKPFSYTRIPSIPSAAARMLWSELLGEVTLVKDEESGIYKMESPDRNYAPKWDHSLTKETIVAFTQWVNTETDGMIPQRNNLFGRLQLKRNDWNHNASKTTGTGRRGLFGLVGKPKDQGTISTDMLEEPETPLQRARKAKDPFLHCIRDFLVGTSFIELSGRRVDDDDDDDDDEDEAGPSEDGIAEENPGAPGNKPEEESIEEADFSGWNERKSKRETVSQYFQIYKDMQHQYGVYLSSLPVRDGGFACLEVKEDEMDSQSGSVAIREHDTMKRWNDAMSRACVRQLVDSNIFQIGSGTVVNAKLPLERNPYNDATSYSLQMYVSHLMRAGKIMESARILMNQQFFKGRVSAVGCFDASNRQRADLEELDRRSQLASEGIYQWGGDGDGIDPEDIINTSVKVMTRVITSLYPITHPEHAPVTSETGEVKGEREEGDVGRALHLIGSFLGERGDSAGAMDAYEEALKYKIAAMGPNHSSVGRTFRHMGHVHLNEYEYDDAVQCYAESVRIERLQNEIDHKRVILALNSMGMIYGMTGKHDDAIDAYAQSLVIQKANLGESHPQVAETLNSMGIVYGMMNVFDKSVECYSEALFIKIRRMGQDHEDVADVQFNLGLLHNKRGDHDSAINCYQEALRIRKEKLGEEHEEVARVLHHIGVALSEMGEVGDAMRFYEECLRIRRLILGEGHEDVARTLHNLGLVYYDSGSYDRSLDCFEDALRLGRQKVGKRSEKVSDTLHSMGLVYQKLAKFDQAIHCYEEAVEIRRNKLGDSHLEVASTLHNTGDVYYMQGDLEKAMEAYEEAFNIRVEKLGDHDVDVAATRNNMGVVFMKQGNHEIAMECFSSALSIRVENLGPDHDKVSDTLHNLGLVHKNLKQYDEAIERYEQALRIRKLQLGGSDMKVADTLYNTAIVYANTGKYAEALERYKEALRTYRETGMTDDHPSVVNTLQWIKWAQKKLARLNRRDMNSSRDLNSSYREYR